MKVRELIEKLTEENLLDLEVVIACDSEGNGFNKLADRSIGIGVYNPDIGLEDLYDTSWSADDAAMEGEEWDFFLENNPHVVVLWP